jgi:hypothetical protein
VRRFTCACLAAGLGLMVSLVSIMHCGFQCTSLDRQEFMMLDHDAANMDDAQDLPALC